VQQSGLEIDGFPMSEDDGRRLIVREATVDDAAALAELIAEFNGPQGDVQETADRLLACAGLEVALLACTPGEIVGFACLRVTPAIGTRTPHALLTELYVRETYRRRGVGRALLQRAEELTRERGATDLYRFTGHQNLTAQAFYARHGYAARGVTLSRPVTPLRPRTGEGPWG